MTTEPRLPRRTVADAKRAGSALIRWRVKGSKEGPIYRGMVEVTPCIGCRQKAAPTLLPGPGLSAPADLPPPPGEPAASPPPLYYGEAPAAAPLDPFHGF
jgi:hypothetical protein